MRTCVINTTSENTAAGDGCSALLHGGGDSCREYLDCEIAGRGLHKSAFLGSAGDTLLWHAQLLHGGITILDKTRTRKSLVTHYWRATDLPPDSAGVFEGNKYYYKRPHQA
ncbi:MAG: hypothetical protein JOY62_07475 [Acidobacteriaceae bacterium]|nr:hypothetical protein [Acidobacteriaceae bacterium]MBV9779798.1 hypothetical protein [Acidobacteriaceae bacterium]